MNYLKLFEDFEEKLFYIIDADDYTDMYDYSVNLDDYTKDIIETIKTRLPKAFNHDQFSCFILEDNLRVFIYERLHSLVEYTFFVAEDDWIYLQSTNRASNKFYKFYKCDGIKGLVEAIKYDFETNQPNTNLYCKLPDIFKSYGLNVLRNNFVTCSKLFLRTPIQFSMAQFPKQQVESILDKLPVKTKLSNIVNQIYSFHFYEYDTIRNVDMPVYYIKEANQFICHIETTRDYYACCGIEGLQELINYLF